MLLASKCMNTYNFSINKSTLGHVKALGWPWQEHKSDIECHFLELSVEMAIWHWMSRSMTIVFNTSPENLKMHIWHKFGDCSANPLQITVPTRRISWNSESQCPKWPWRSRSMTLILIRADAIPGCTFGANSMSPSRICEEFSFIQKYHIIFWAWEFYVNISVIDTLV